MIDSWSRPLFLFFKIRNGAYYRFDTTGWGLPHGAWLFLLSRSSVDIALVCCLQYRHSYEKSFTHPACSHLLLGRCHNSLILCWGIVPCLSLPWPFYKLESYQTGPYCWRYLSHNIGAIFLILVILQHVGGVITLLKN